MAAASFASCNNAGNKTNDTDVKMDSSITEMQSNTTQTQSETPINEILTGYLQVKNALAEDNGNDAANGGKAIAEAMAKLDKSYLSATQKKVYDAVADDIKENALHINENSGKIDHQREHFEMLSQDMYDLVKSFDGTQTLYKDFCPMANDNKGAFWISETKEIKNPYLGKKMPTCGEVKILLAVFIVFIIIQFIQPAHNTSDQVLPTDITKICTVPDSVQHVLKVACYDCHSNNTRYPLYSYIQPAACCRGIKRAK